MLVIKNFKESFCSFRLQFVVNQAQTVGYFGKIERLLRWDINQSFGNA